MNDPYSNTSVAVSELVDAVDAGLLTKEEARLIMWSQFPALRQAASVTPPPVGEKS